MHDDLIARIEASGPDRHLDWQIHDVLCDGFDMMPDATEADIASLLPEGADVAAIMEECGGFAVMKVPQYTRNPAGTIAKLRMMSARAAMGGGDE